MLQSVPVTWTQTVSSAPNETWGPSPTSHLPFAHEDRRRREKVELDGGSLPVDLPELKNTCRAALDARRAADAFRVLHRDPFVREVHDVDALVADRGADIARDTLLLVRRDRETAEPGVDMHERGKRTEEPAPHPPREPEVETVADDPDEKHVDAPLIGRLEQRIECRIDPVPGRERPPDDPDHEERPREDEAVRAPELPAVPVVHDRKERVGDAAREESVVIELREDDLGQEKERNDLDEHERQGLHRDVGSATPPDALQAEQDDDR